MATQLSPFQRAVQLADQRGISLAQALVEIDATSLDQERFGSDPAAIARGRAARGDAASEDPRDRMGDQRIIDSTPRPAEPMPAANPEALLDAGTKVAPVDLERPPSINPSAPIAGGPTASPQRFNPTPPIFQQPSDQPPPPDTRMEYWTKLGHRVTDQFGSALGGVMQYLHEQSVINPTGSVAGSGWTPEQRQQLERQLNAERIRDPGWGQRLYNAATEDFRANELSTSNNLPSQYVGMVVDSIGMMAPTIAVTIATRSPTLGVVTLGSMAGGQQYADSRADHRSIANSTMDGIFYGAAEAIPEAIPLHALMRPGGRFLGNVLRTAGLESVSEVFTQVLETGYDMNVLHHDMTWGQALAAVRDAGIVGFFLGGSMQAAAHPMNRMAEARRTMARDAIIHDISTNAAAVEAQDPGDRLGRTVNPADPTNIDSTIQRYGTPQNPTYSSALPTHEQPGDAESPIATEDIARGRELIDTELKAQAAPEVQADTSWIDNQQQQVEQALPPEARHPRPAPAQAAPTFDNMWSAIIGNEGGTDRRGNFLTSPAGAIGPAQVMPGTAPEAARLAGLPWDDHRYRTDPEYNITIGQAYFREKLREFNGDPEQAAAAYNAGAGRVRSAIRRAREQGGSWTDYLPPETQTYVRNFRERVGGNVSRGTFEAPAAPPSPEVPDAMAAARNTLGQDFGNISIPEVGGRVEVAVGEAAPQQATVTGRFDENGEPGVALQFDDGTTQEELLSTLQSRGARISPVVAAGGRTAALAAEGPVAPEASPAPRFSTAKNGNLLVTTDQVSVDRVREQTGLVGVRRAGGSYEYPASVADRVQQAFQPPIISDEQYNQISQQASQFLQQGAPEPAITPEAAPPPNEIGGDQAANAAVEPVPAEQAAPVEDRAKIADKLDERMFDIETEGTKGSVKTLANRMMKLGIIDQQDVDALVLMLKDRDLGVEDGVSELRTSLRMWEEGGVGTAPAGAQLRRTAAPVAVQSRAQVAVEVAPNPQDAGLSGQWNALSFDQRAVITEKVADAIVPNVLDAVGVSATSHTTVGGYLDDVNPSITLDTADGAQARAAAKALGYVFGQESTIVLGAEGGETVGVVTIEVPRGDSPAEIYQALRGIDGQPVSGFMMEGDRMVVLNFSDMDTAALADRIDRALGGAYMVADGEASASFIGEGEYGTVETGERLAPAEDLDRLRQEAAALRQRAIDEAGNERVADAGRAPVGWTEARIDQLIDAASRDRQRTHFVALIDPADFVNATTNQEFVPALAQEAGPLDAARLDGAPNAPSLTADLAVRRSQIEGAPYANTIGHAGRHRMVALSNAGVTKFPVVIRVDLAGQAAPSSLNLSPQSSTLREQQGSVGIGVSGLLEISRANKDGLLNIAGPQFSVSEKVARESEVERFQQRIKEAKTEIEQYEVRLRKILNALNVDAHLRVFNVIRPPSGSWMEENGQSIEGYHDSGLIAVAIKSGRDPYSTVDHEVIHFLRYANAFTETEWNILVSRAHSDRALFADVKERYHDLPTENLNEELVAEMFSWWREDNSDTIGADGRPIAKPKSTIDRIFTKIAQILYALKKALGGRENAIIEGLKIMERIEAGEHGQRVRDKYGTRLRDDAARSDMINERFINRADREAGRRDFPVEYSLTRVSKNAFPDNSVEADYLTHRTVGPPKPVGMKPNEYDLFSRKIMLDDLRWNQMNGDPLPHGLTDETLRAARLKIDKLVEASPTAKSAVRRFKFAQVLKEAAKTVVPEEAVGAAKPLEDGERPIAGNIRLDNLKSSQDIDKALQTIAGEFDNFKEARRGVVSHDQMMAFALESGVPVQVLLQANNGDAWSAERLLSARMLLVTSADNLVKLAREAIATNSDANLLAFRKAWVLHVAIQERVSGLTAEAGRALNQFNVMAKAGGDLNARMIKEVLEVEGGRGDIENVIQAIILNSSDPAKLNRFARDAYNPTWRDQLFELWMMGLLSGPATHVVNATSNTITSLSQPLEFGLAVGVGKIRSLFSAETERITGSEFKARLTGYYAGVLEGATLAAETFRTGEGSDVLSKLEARHQRAIPGKIGEAVRIPGRLLLTSDEFFKGIARRQEIVGQAARIATKEGLTGEDWNSRVQELSMNPTDDMMEKAIDFARYTTFNRPLGPKGQAITNVINRVPGLRLIVPFIRTPTNIFKYAIERTPAAPILKEVRDDLAAGGAARDLALARIAIGSGMAAMVIALALQGIITGGPPPDKATNQMLRSTGWTPYSVKIDGVYYSYQRLDPLATIIGLAADLVSHHENMSAEEESSVIATVLTAMMAQTENKTFLAGIGNLAQALQDPGRYGQNFIGRLAGTVVPTGVAQLNNSYVDPTLRDTRSIVDHIRARVPGLSSELPARRDIWGAIITRQGGVGPDIASPFWVSADRNDNVTAQLLRAGARVDIPSRNVGSGPTRRELTAEEYDRYQERAGQLLRQDAEELVNSPDWAEMDDAGRREEFDRVKNAARRDAREELGLSAGR